MSTVLPMITVYRRILKAASVFPSRKRANIIVEIKAEFRKHRVRASHGLAELSVHLVSTLDLGHV